MLLPERLEGAVYGHLVGDALGVPYEFLSPDRVGTVEWRGHGSHDQPSGTWSDDGALMLALLDSLLPARFDPADQARRALAWRDEGAYAPGGRVFDIGNATSSALQRLRSGTPPEEAGAPDALGNGSLMRILPVALVFRETTDRELIDSATRASPLTHGSAEAQLACALYTLIVRRLLAGASERESILGEAVATLRAQLAADGLPGSRVAAAPESACSALDTFLAWPGREGHGHVTDSFWSAWEAFAVAGGYQDAVVAAVRLGHDTDTTAAIAGGLAGAYWGIDDVPSAWHRGLRDRHIPQALVDRLIATDASEWSGTAWRTSTESPLRVDGVDLSGTDLATTGGSLGLTFLPGKRYMGYYTGPHWRDLDSDAAELRRLGIDVLVLLVGRDAILAMAARLRDGGDLAIACRGGLDRTGMTAACLLVEAGLEPDTAIDRVHAARSNTLSLPVQIRYVRAWRRSA